MILDIFLYILLTILAILVIIISIKVTLCASYQDEKPLVYVKILCFKFDVLKIIKKTKKSKKTSEKVEEKPEKEQKKFAFDVEKLDEYMQTLSDILDILNQFAFCFTIKKLYADVNVQTDDNAKTGKLLGTLWVLYGNVTVFLHNNFIIKHYDVNFTPVWDKNEQKISANAQIIVHTRILRVLCNIKYKKINEIRKRELI